MKIKILSSGSRGNCYILTDVNDSQLILDCGIKYEKIATELNWGKPIACLISHKHEDHYNESTVNRMFKFGLKVFTPTTADNGVSFAYGDWRILPIELPHDKDCSSFSFIIYNVTEGKSIYYATDCTALPRIADRVFDLFMIENNYDQQTVFQKRLTRNGRNNLGYLRHLSMEYLVNWLKDRKSIVRNLLITHLSNSGNISIDAIINGYDGLCDRLYIAKENLFFEF